MTLWDFFAIIGIAFCIAALLQVTLKLSDTYSIFKCISTLITILSCVFILPIVMTGLLSVFSDWMDERRIKNAKIEQEQKRLRQEAIANGDIVPTLDDLKDMNIHYR